MKFKATVKTIATLQLVIATCLVGSALVALLIGEREQIGSFLMPAALITFLAAATLAVFRHIPREILLTREGFLLVTLSWISVSLSGSLPFVLSGVVPSYADAFFEAMSGFTTTGASILTNIEAVPRSILFWRSLTHWLGGMGIVVLTVACTVRLHNLSVNGHAHHVTAPAAAKTRLAPA